jgi:signal transduction histidine kinase
VNKLLFRQINRKLGKDFEPSDNLKDLLKIISDSYDHFERDRKIIERAMEVSSVELRESYGKLAVQKELERKNIELENFVSIASHDLKAPLRTVNSFSNVLKKKLKNEAIYPSIEEFLDLIISSTLRMENLIQDLLEYSSIGNNSTVVEEVNLGQILSSVEKNIYSLLNENKATLFYENLPSVKAIPHQMLQLFQNLIGNAIKFKRDNVDPIVKIICEEDEQGNYQFSITDNGIGIEENQLSKVFEPFKRLESARKFKGSGLGLSICKSIVETMNGKIWVESQKGIGTTFIFTIPKSDIQKKKEHQKIEIDFKVSN